MTLAGIYCATVDGQLKLGRSRDVCARVQNLGRDVSLLAAIQVSNYSVRGDIEWWIHAHMHADTRIIGEWYVISERSIARALLLLRNVRRGIRAENRLHLKYGYREARRRILSYRYHGRRYYPVERKEKWLEDRVA